MTNAGCQSSQEGTGHARSILVRHLRPVILDEGDYDAWLAGETIPLVPFDSERMTARPISTTINNVKNQRAECVETR